MNRGLTAICLFDFKARQRDELSVSKGNTVYVLSGADSDEDWWLVTDQCGEISGLVPSNFLRLLPHSASPCPEETSPPSRAASFQAPESPLHSQSYRLEPVDAPGDWCSARDEESGDIYYFNRETGESQWELPDGVLAGEVRHSAVELEGYVWSYVESPRMRSAGDEIDNETINQLKMLKDQVGARINDISAAACDDGGSSRDCSETSLRTHDNGASSLVSVKEEVIDGVHRTIQSRCSPDKTETVKQEVHQRPPESLPPIRQEAPMPTTANASHTESKPRDVEFPPIVVSAMESKVSINDSNTGDEKGLDDEDIVEEAGFQHCRTKLYAPTTYDATRQEALTSDTTRLDLGFSLGYNGDHKKYHSHSIKGNRGTNGCADRNIFWMDDSIIAYPVAALVVLLIINGERAAEQLLINLHSEEITAMSYCTLTKQFATAQSGRSPRVVVWEANDYISSLRRGRPFEASSSVKLEIILDSSYRGVSSVSFSGDGDFLAVVTADDVHSLMIYDMKLVEHEHSAPIATVKLGHAEVSQIGFNPVQYIGFRCLDIGAVPSPGKSATPMKSRSEDGDAANVYGNKLGDPQRKPGADKTIDLYTGCYTLFSCLNRSMKLWTLYKYKELVDPGVVEVSGFKGRRMAMPKRMQQWKTKYNLAGALCTIPKASAAAVVSDITCCCVVKDVNSDHGFPSARLFCGTNSGSIVVWRQTEASTVDDVYSLINSGSKSRITSRKLPTEGEKQGLGWLPRGQFLFVVTDVQTGPLHDIDVWNSSSSTERTPREGSVDVFNKTMLSTCGRDNVLNVWGIVELPNQHRKQVPIEHIKSVPLKATYGEEEEDGGNKSNNMGPMDGVSRALTISPSGNAVIVGMTSNSLYKIYGKNGSIPASESRTCVEAVMRGHLGSVKRVARHPTEDIFATIATDRSLRVWSVRLKKQLGVAFIKDDHLTSLCFSPDGSHIIVGTATLGNVLLFRLDTESPECGNSRPLNGVTLTLALRKKVVSKKSKEKQVVSKASKEPASSRKSVPNADNQERGQKDKVRGLEKAKDIELLDVCYSPDSSVLAVACKNGNVYLFSAEEKYKRYAVCRTHGSTILRMAFSKDGAVIQINDSALALSYWNTDTGLQLTDSRHLRDVEWSGWYSTCGWPVQGIHNDADGNDGPHERTNVVCRSHDEALLAVGTANDVSGSIKIFSCPALQHSKADIYRAHSSCVNDVCFTHSDKHIVSCGGFNDSSIVLWNVVRY